MLAPQVNIASRAARQAGKLLRRAAEDVSTLSVEKKGMNDFVTEVDRASEMTIIEILQKAYPDHSILGEETGLIEGKGEGQDWQWVIDPLDGTTNFIHGFPQFCISIALKYKGRVEHGVIYDPLREEEFTASRGRGAALNGRRLRVTSLPTLEGALIGTLLSLLSTRGLARYPRLVPVFRRIMDIMRAVPEVVIALVLIFVLGGGPVPAMIAIAFHTSGAIGKLFSEVNENADLKPVEGLRSTGATWGQQMWLGVIPQVAPNWLSYALLRFEINVRASAILGFVGSGGIGYELKVAMQWGGGRYDPVVAIFLLLFLTIVVIDQTSDRLRHRLVKGH